MADTVFSRQLDAAELRYQMRLEQKPMIVGRAWFNIALAGILMAIAVWVYRSPLAEAINLGASTAPVVGRTEQAAVDNFNLLLGDAVQQKAQEKVVAAQKAAEAEQVKVAKQQAAFQAAEAKKAAAPTKVVGPTATGNGTRPTAGSNGGNKRLAGPPTTKAPLPELTTPSKAALLTPGSSYYGVSLPQAPFFMGEVNAFKNMVGKSPNMIMYFQTFDQPFRPEVVENSWRGGALPLITWEPETKVPGATPVKLSRIAAGENDAYLTQYASAVRDFGHPVAIRFGHEMNGRWYPWSEGKFGNKPGDYVAAARHVHDVFQRAGATNVIWVWSPNRTGDPQTPLSQVYPGDEYVDWSALSGYYRTATDAAPSFNATFADALDNVRAVSSKPILLAEIGAGTTVENRVAWLDSMFATLPEHPDVIGFVYFNYDKQTVEDSQNWRIEIDPTVTEAFRRGVADPRYGAGA